MAGTCLKVAEDLLLHGRLDGERLERRAVFNRLGVAPRTFASAGEKIGAVQARPGNRFFDSSVSGRISFGPGAGLAIGVSLGSQTLRAVIVDANGWCYAEHESAPMEDQLAEPPAVVLDRIGSAVGVVCEKALALENLLVDGALPILGCGVAWPTPVDRHKHPAGHALAHGSWRSRQPLDERVSNCVPFELPHSYAMNDAHAAAIAIAHRRTHVRGYQKWTHPRLTIMLRLGGGVGGAVIVIEPIRESRKPDPSSGFPRSILMGGFDNFAGEIGHANVNAATVDQLNKRRPAKLRPLKAHSCTCTRAKSAPLHLEAYTSAFALCARIDPRKPMHEVLPRIISEPTEARHERALSDIGALLGEALVTPATFMNPAEIVVTGRMAVPALRDGITRRISEEHQFGHEPKVELVDDAYICAEGAALALIRDEVHRELDQLLTGDGEAVAARLGNHTLPVRRTDLP